MLNKKINLPVTADEEKGKIIGLGNTAAVYEWGNDKVIKIFKAGYSPYAITNEYYNALAIRNMDFGKAIVYELKQLGDTYGIVYEKLEGELLLDYLMRTEDISGTSKILCSLQKDINKNKFAGDRATVKETLQYWLRNSEHSESSAAHEMIRMLDTMPDGEFLCHGDYHPGNVILTDEGPKVIDFQNLCRGEILYDIARTVFLMGHTPLPEGTSDVDKMNEMRLELTEAYINDMGVTEMQLGGYLSMIIAARSGEK